VLDIFVSRVCSPGRVYGAIFISRHFQTAIAIFTAHKQRSYNKPKAINLTIVFKYI